MRRILITPQIQLIADEYLNDVISKLKNTTKITLENEIDDIKRSKLQDWKLYVKYLKNIVKLYDSLVILHPKYFKYYWNRYFSFSKKIDMNSTLWKKNTTIKFHKMVEDAMAYKKVRDEIIVPFIKRLNIRTCVNCNSEYILSVNKPSKLDDGSYAVELKGRFQLDHFWAKSKYPFLSICFFNLQPSCGFCNLWKREKDGKFNLYTDFYQKINPFVFLLDKRSLLNYLLSSNIDQIHIELNSKERGLKKNHEEVFCINEIYKLLNDEAEELIWKARIYNKSFVGQLQQWLKNQFTRCSEKDLFRFVHGFYPRIEDIHKRPLTKIKQDVAKQLGLV